MALENWQSPFRRRTKNESIGKKILVLLTGYKVSIEKVKAKWHLYPLEDVEKTDKGIKRKLVVFQKMREETP
jgi:hypothetical protein